MAARPQRSTSPARSGVFTGNALRDLIDWTAQVEAWPPGSHRFGHYEEMTAAGARICRTENVSLCHRGIATLVDGVLRDIASEELGEPAGAFKDKINYKQPGGAGFRPHQDVTAYPGAHRVVSLLVAVDSCTRESGCLWLAGGVSEALPTDDRGVVRGDVVERLVWEAFELAPGDAVVLDGFTPHRSDANASSAARRVLVASYAPVAQGYTRAEYYGARAAVMAQATQRDGRFRISTLADFDGAQVDTELDERADGGQSTNCTHPPSATS